MQYANNRLKSESRCLEIRFDNLDKKNEMLKNELEGLKMHLNKTWKRAK